MNKTAIKNYAVWARRKLIESVKQRAFEMEITDGGANDSELDTVGGQPLVSTEKAQRAQLIAEIKARGYETVMEEAAYTWFNRFIALRYMEVNGYLPSKVRVFTDENGEFKPEILKQALSMDLEGLDRNRLLSLLDTQNNEGLYQYLLITQCNALNEALPYMFETISNWTELLFPANLLRPDSVIGRMISDIPEEDWTDAVQIIGWLYQYYNSELKDETYDLLKKNVKISKERLPSATQLFTPDWIVRYMVENSLGRLAVSSQLSSFSGKLSEAERIAKEKEITENYGWKYYLPETEQTPEVRELLNALAPSHLPLVTLKFIDPCMGSGHVIVYAFDILMQLYAAEGWSERDAARSILENNLYGLDIDTRAGQLAYFAVMMKARKYNRRTFSAGIRPNIFAIQDSDFINDDLVRFVSGEDTKLQNTMWKLKETFRDAKEYGSLIQPDIPGLSALREKVRHIAESAPQDLIAAHFREIVQEKLLPLLNQAEMLSQKYDVVCTNPPYMGNSGLNDLVSSFVKEFYTIGKMDLFSVFMLRCDQLLQQNGFYGMITQPSWLFLSTFEKLRKSILNNNTISSLLHMGRGIFGIDFGSVAFCIRKNHIQGYIGNYFRLHQRTFQYIDPDDIAKLYLLASDNHDYVFDFSTYQTSDSPKEINEESTGSQKIYYSANQENFSKIPGSPIAYWVGEGMLKSFENPKLGDIAEPRQGLATADNNRFLRLWYECEQNRICYDAGSTEEASQSGRKWFPYNKGGDFRKWYGNNDYVVNWENDGYEIKHFVDENGKLRSVTRNPNFYFRECASWSLISSSATAFRYKSKGFIFDVAGMSLFTSKDLLYLLGFCNTNLTYDYLKIIAPTINFQVGDIAKLPVIISEEKKDTVETIVQNNIEMSKTDWDSFETSWDFKKHPLV